MKQFRKKLIRRLTIGTSAALLAVALLVLLVTLYSLNTAGVCVKRGRILSEPELRKAVLRSLVQNSMDRANLNFAYDTNEHYRSGIIRTPSQTPFPELIDEFFNNDKSFEENFKIEVIAPRDRGFSVDSLQEPFVLVDYELLDHGIAQFTASNDIYKVEISGRQRTVEFPEWSKKWPMTDLYRRILGFGNHYYQMKWTSFPQDCCGNRHYLYQSFSEKDSLEKKRYVQSKEWIAKKRAAYEESKKWLADDYFLRKFHRGIAQVSNCGGILTFREDDTGLGLPSIRWLRLIDK